MSATCRPSDLPESPAPRRQLCEARVQPVLGGSATLMTSGAGVALEIIVPFLLVETHS